MVAAPDSIRFAASDSAIYKPRTNSQFKKVNFFIAKNLTSRQKATFVISGKGEMFREPQQAAGAANGAPEREESSGPGGGLGLPTERPDPLHSDQWLFLGILSLFLAVAAVVVYTFTRKRKAAFPSPVDSQTQPVPLMEALKDEMFELESEWLLGKMRAEDYQIAKAALDTTLQRTLQPSRR